MWNTHGARYIAYQKEKKKNKMREYGNRASTSAHHRKIKSRTRWKRDGLKSVRETVSSKKAHTKAQRGKVAIAFISIFTLFSLLFVLKIGVFCMRLRIKWIFVNLYTQFFRLTFAHTHFAVIENQPSFFSFHFFFLILFLFFTRCSFFHSYKI